MKPYASQQFLTILTGILLLSLYSPLHAQDAGFFLDGWQEKTAEIPEYEIAAKPSAAPSVTVRIDMDQVVNKVPQYIFGNNAVTWDNGLPYNATAMTDLKNLNPHILRWPGGSLSDHYFWNLPVGQRPADIPADISPWYGQETENWQMSTDEYYTLLERTNSTGIIVVNYGYARYGTGPDPVAAAAHMAAEWVRYDNGRSRFWEIGNENFGNWEGGYKIDPALNQDGQPEFISGKLYGEHCRVFMDSMRAAAVETGAEIKIGVVTYDAETSWDPIQTVWNEQMMAEVGDLADFLIVHSYFTPYDQDSPVSTILNSHVVPEEIMSVLVGDMAEAGKPMIPVAMTEWNIFAQGSMQMVSYINGMLAALVLGEFIRNDYGLGTRWDLVNGWSNGNDHAMFSTGGEPGVDPYNPRAVFFYMYYFQKYFGDRMVGSAVTGNSQIVAHASSFSSGESGMVIVNKSTSTETAEVEIDNFDPGARYYYHTLTGGSDNGDFSRKVYVNGIGTDEEGGGPDEYESIRAHAGKVEGGIRVSLPPLSVVYLMVDRHILSYLSSKVDTSASVIDVELSGPFTITGDPPGFEVTVNGTTPVPVAGLGSDPGHPQTLQLLLGQDLTPGDLITLAYSGNQITTVDGAPLVPFSEVVVENLLPGAPPILNGAHTDSTGNVIRLLFNMEMQAPGTVADSFMLLDDRVPLQHISISGVEVDGDDPHVLLLTPSESLFAEFELVLSYRGTGIMSLDGGVLEPFDSIPVINKAPGLPPGPLGATVADFGFAIQVHFSKPMKDMSPYDTDFTVKVNHEAYPVEAVVSAADRMTISLADHIRYGDSVAFSYGGTGVTSVDGGVLPFIESFLVDNRLAEAHIFEVPGAMDAELFSVTRGMVLQPCSDVGGGYNLGSIEAGDWAEYEVNVLQSGYYKGNVRVAATTNMGRLIIQTPDGEPINLDTVSVPATGGWQQWESVPVELVLQAGRQRLRLTALTSYFNINWLELELDRTLEASVLSAETNETGDTIRLQFDRKLVPPQDGEESSFTVMAGGIPVSVDQLFLQEDPGTTLLLSLGQAISADQQDITVSYEAGNLIATDLIPVPSFSGLQVANQVITSVRLSMDQGISIYPNPVGEVLNIDLPGRQADPVVLQLFDVTGQMVHYREYKIPGDPSTIQVEVGHLREGFYLLRIRVGSDTIEQSIVIQ